MIRSTRPSAAASSASCSWPHALTAGETTGRGQLGRVDASAISRGQVAIGALGAAGTAAATAGIALFIQIAAAIDGSHSVAPHITATTPIGTRFLAPRAHSRASTPLTTSRPGSGKLGDLANAMPSRPHAPPSRQRDRACLIEPPPAQPSTSARWQSSSPATLANRSDRRGRAGQASSVAERRARLVRSRPWPLDRPQFPDLSGDGHSTTLVGFLSAIMGCHERQTGTLRRALRLLVDPETVAERAGSAERRAGTFSSSGTTSRYHTARPVRS